MGSSHRLHTFPRYKRQAFPTGQDPPTRSLPRRSLRNRRRRLRTRIQDGVRIQPVLRYRSGISPLCPNRSGPSGTTRCPRTAPSQACVAGCPSSTVTSAAPARQRRQHALDMRHAPRVAAPPGPHRRQPPRMQPVRRGDRQQPRPRLLLAQLRERRLSLRRHRPLIRQRDPRALAPAAPPNARRRSPPPDPAPAPAAPAPASTAAATPPTRPAAA